MIFTIIPALLPVIWMLDDMLATGNILLPYLVTLIPLSLVMFYPTCHEWSTARSDSTLMLAVGAGTALSLWLIVHGGFHQVEVGEQFATVSLERAFAGMFTFHAVLRAVIGFVLLVAIRFVMKLITVTVFSTLAGRSSKEAIVKQLVSVQLPCKFATYTSIALGAVFIAPLLFTAIGINRPGMFLEYNI